MTEIAGHEIVETQRNDAGAAEGGTLSVEPREVVPSPPFSPIIAQLIEWQNQRRFAIRGQSSADRRCDSYVARHLGYHGSLPMAERKALFKRAAEIRLDYEKSVKKLRKQLEKAAGRPERDTQTAPARGEGRGGQQSIEPRAVHAPSALLPVLDASLLSREPHDAMRTEAEANMVRLAEALPVWPRCAEVAGFGALGLAVLVAEAGNDLSGFPHWYHLWKRLGLAPYRGRAMSSWMRAGRKGEALSAAEWKEQGYNPVRRGTLAGDIGAALFFAKARHVYGDVYTERRAHTALTHPEWTPKHSDNDARRVMLKALVRDVWRWWRDAAIAGQNQGDTHSIRAGTAEGAAKHLEPKPSVPSPPRAAA